MRVVQICGSAPGVEAIPSIPGGRRWILGAAWQTQGDGPWDVAFDVHSRWHIGTRRPAVIDWYAKQTKPIVVLEPVPEVPRAQLFNVEALRAFGRRGYQARSSSIDYMMAQAILDGFEQIHVIGVRMLTIEEWVEQRECLAYWIGQAEGRGIEVLTDPWGSFCLPDTIYGTGEQTGAWRKPAQPLPMEAFA